jgi:hypothetical protein
LKHILLLGVLLVFSSCSLVASWFTQFPEGVTGSQDGITWHIILADTIQGVTIGSGSDILNLNASAPCEYTPVTAGPKRALKCNAPNDIKFTTESKPFVTVLNFKPL